MKKIFSLVILSAGTLMAQETSLMDVKLWSAPFKTAEISQKGEYIAVKGTNEVHINKKFKCNPETLYKFSTMVRSDIEKGNLRIALRMYDSQKREIAICHYIYKPESLTEVVENAPRGSKILKLKDISKWNKDVFSFCALAFHAKEDFSDLPNFMIIPLRVTGVKQEDGISVLELSSPTTVDLRAGTKVRQHYFGGANYYTPFVPITREWKTVSGHAEGIRKGSSVTANTFAPGTAEFSISFYFFSIKKDQTIELKGVKLIEE